MFSKKGKTTSSMYIAFMQEDPLVGEERRRKQLDQQRTDYTAGIVPGKPSTLTQEAKFRGIQKQIQEEDERFMNNLHNRARNLLIKNETTLKTKFQFREKS